MARGWESKSVEDQIEAARSKRPVKGVALDSRQQARLRERESLELSRTRVLHDLESAVNQRYREQLKLALAHLDRRLSELDLASPAKS